jgi:hypothetical protein
MHLAPQPKMCRCAEQQLQQGQKSIGKMAAEAISMTSNNLGRQTLILTVAHGLDLVAMNESIASDHSCYEVQM